MNRRLHTATPAADELAAAVSWYENRRAGLGAEFYDAIVRTMNRIAEMPETGSQFRDLNARRMLVACFPYQVVYRVDSEGIRAGRAGAQLAHARCVTERTDSLIAMLCAEPRHRFVGVDDSHRAVRVNN